ncbi:cytochrome b561 domain-containing protein At4g18260 [Malania oleifera]|uniref:cytochrome b561 domain-containing protein At4g18260 n=1 Tax=Malania oleifera TaxID=397392 RepID=UPI0025AE3C20|nr:cytochrome b561 domain-containing protein At4g18260 [Malania oleifera]
MLIFHHQKLASFTNKFASLIFIFLLPIVGRSSHELTMESSSHHSINRNIYKPSREMTLDIALHGVLLWASMGFLMPLGILTIRMSNKVDSGRNLKALFYSHLILQVVAVGLATAGAVLSIKKFENSFDNSHQRVGLALYLAIWVQVLTAFCRRHRGSKGRSVWYFMHWILGTTISLAGIINVYTGLKAYHRKTSKGIWLWTLLFSAEVSFLAFLYLFQDKWEYMQKQGVVLGTNEEPAAAADGRGDPQSHTPIKLQLQLQAEPHKKRNALMNYLK